MFCRQASCVNGVVCMVLVSPSDIIMTGFLPIQPHVCLSVLCAVTLTASPFRQTTGGRDTNISHREQNNSHLDCPL